MKSMLGSVSVMARFLLLISLLTTVASPLWAQGSQFSEYCQDDGRFVFFLVDTTTPYDNNDKRRIEHAYMDFLRSLKTGDRVISKTIGDHVTLSEEIASICWPGCKEGGFLGGLSCPQGKVKSDRIRGAQQLKMALAGRLQHFEETRHSSIAYTLQSVFHAIPAERKALLFIYSDMIENSREIPLRKFLRARNPKNAFHGIQFDKKIEAEVFIYGVGRSAGADRKPLTIDQINKIKKNWEHFFRKWGIQKIIWKEL